MTFTAYQVRIIDGPAQGWGYQVLIPPDETIHLVPWLRGSDHANDWLRVPAGEVPWPGQRSYRQVPGSEGLTADGDLAVDYRALP